MFLTWGSDVDSDIAAANQSGKPGGRVWLAAPIHELSSLSDEKKYERPDGTKLSDRDVVRLQNNFNRFYIPPFPSDDSNHLGRYVDFKKIAPVGIRAFLDGMDKRIAGVTLDALNDLYHHLCWHLTRAEIFFHPITCTHCGYPTRQDIRFEGQNIVDDPWV